MPTTTPKSSETMRMIATDIENVQSRYSDSIAAVVAHITWQTDAAASSADERRGLAIAHRLLADFIEQLPETGRWTAPSVESASFAKTITATIRYELCTGDDAEIHAIHNAFVDAIPAID